MSTAIVASKYGHRSLPEALEILAITSPHRLYATVPKASDTSDGFMDISCLEISRSVDFMAHWIDTHLKTSDSFETVSYIGSQDLRSAVIFLAAVKCGFKVLLPSPRNPPATNASLMEQTQCTVVLHTSEVASVVKSLGSIRTGLHTLQVPSFQEMLDSRPKAYPFGKSFDDIEDEPVLVLHSSGSTGIPKPITMTHGTFAVLDRERNLPTVPGRRNRDYSIWDMEGGGRFYTVFPYFHLAGFLSLLVNPLFTEVSTPVLGPPLMPPSGMLLKEVLQSHNIRALYLPPSIPEQLLMEPGGIEFFKGLDFLCYTGGPFSPSAGEKLSQVTELVPLYGSTEAFQVPQLAPNPDDWAWLEWNPKFELEMQPSEDELGTYELVLFADNSTRKMSALNHNLPGIKEYHTKDLFKQHPRKPRLWQYYGRRDDIIVLSNGEKFNPVPLELHVQGHSALAGALVVGHGRSKAKIILEPSSDTINDNVATLIDVVWPLIEQGNRLVPAQGRILRNSVLIASPQRPFVRAGKGTVIRKLTERLYKEDIDSLYSKEDEMPVRKLAVLESVLRPYYEIDMVIRFVRGTIDDLFPELSGISEDDDLFSSGLDSVMIGQLLSNLRAGMHEASPGCNKAWLDTRIIYRNSSIKRLGLVLSDFMNNSLRHESDATRSAKDLNGTRVDSMDSMIAKYTQDLGRPSGEKFQRRGRCVALIGSTGYLGPHILAAILADKTISSIYCLNRGVDAKERTESALHTFGLMKNISLDRATFVAANIGDDQFALSTPEWIELVQNANTIVYNAWKPNWSIPLHAFEDPFVSGTRRVIEWARTSPLNPRIVFISSLAAVGNWTKVTPSACRIEEAPIINSNVAMHMGYGESKCVAERILQAAHQSAGIPVDIIRTGQIGGQSTKFGGAMPVDGWLAAILSTSRLLGAVPTHVSPIDWLAVDILAKQVSDVVASTGGDDNTYRVFNLVHPKQETWNLFLDTLSSKFDFNMTKLSLPDWLRKLDEQSQSDLENQSKYIALKFFDFLSSLGEGEEDMLSDCANIGLVSQAKTEPLTEDILAMWMRGWEF